MGCGHHVTGVTIGQITRIAIPNDRIGRLTGERSGGRNRGEGTATTGRSPARGSRQHPAVIPGQPIHGQITYLACELLPL